MIYVGGEGPADARVMVIGDCIGEQEEYSGRPFTGHSGKELTKMLHEAGIIRRDCYLTNVYKRRPYGDDLENLFVETKKDAEALLLSAVHGKYPLPETMDHVFDLYCEIALLDPEVIILTGNVALWAVTGQDGITDWRGSVMYSLPINGKQYKCIPTFNPAAVMRMWEWRNLCVHDFKRAKGEFGFREIRYPKWDFTIRPTYDQVLSRFAQIRLALSHGPTKLSVDIETRKSRIACFGIAWSKTEAICVPLFDLPTDADPMGHYWSLDAEVEILDQFRRILTHPNARIIGQNYQYDTQYFARELGVKSLPWFDTMIAQHVLFPGMQKALHFIASLYCEFYQYWKDDGKEWDESQPVEQWWRYNCMDCVYTYEAAEVLNSLITDMGQREQFEFQMRLFWPVLKIMLRGVRQSPERRAQYLARCLEAMAERQRSLEEQLGHQFNPRSSKQMQALFYTDFAQRPVLHKKTRRPTLDDDAVELIAQREPLLKSICDDINAFRSLGQFVGALKARIDPDMRMRCSFNLCGTETFRWSSSINAFGTGTNLQNVSTGQRRPELNLPNVRECFLPDQNYILLEPDLAGADAQVVAWEANDEKLKAAFRAGLKVHAVNAKDIFGNAAGPDGRREPYYTRTKVGVHLTNYGGRARTCATALGLTVHEAERFQKRWFDIHPEILDWHRRIEDELLTRRYVENRFGYRRYYYGRIENCFTEALAWVPQSTVALTINRGLIAIDENLPWCQILLQVHDSLLLQIPLAYFPYRLPEVRTLLLNPIPYDDPLTIRTDLKVSKLSWGEEDSYAWPDMQQAA